jgi:hypothetical protein
VGTAEEAKEVAVVMAAEATLGVMAAATNSLPLERGQQTTLFLLQGEGVVGNQGPSLGG